MTHPTAQAETTLPSASAPAMSVAPSVTAQALSFEGIDGAPIRFSELQGKLVLVVNTASQCGFTPQYAGLQTLYERYKDRGLVIIGVPSNDFGGQEPGDGKEISAFTQKEFHVTFPLTAKQVVSGEQAHPFFQWVTKAKGSIAAPRWNFYKYLVAPNGELVAWFASTTAPEDTELVNAIERHLPPPQTMQTP